MEHVPFKAHARLLTMLGEQLIKNERIALVELVKNAYDADATVVKVNFVGFGAGFEALPGSSIEIQDDGVGMSSRIVRGAWMNPATPMKALIKAASPVTAKGRVLQGEKGIGRFAAFKLGRALQLRTRATGDDSVTELSVDISHLDDDKSVPDTELFLDSVTAAVVQRSAREDEPTGTRLIISGIRGSWSESVARDVFADLVRMQPLLWQSEQDASKRSDFMVVFLKDGEDLGWGARQAEELAAVLQRAVLEVEAGSFSTTARSISFRVNDRPIELALDSPELRGIRRFRERFRDERGSWRDPTCGSFEFKFYIFDFDRTAAAEYQLDAEEKALLKDHRVYLYRDGVRVYPYGDPRDDWLEVDAIRGTESARSMFSNDQTLGFVSISQASNPKLRDKTNREGLIEEGSASGDFVAVLQSVLSYLRSKPYEQYSAAKRRSREKSLRSNRVENELRTLRDGFELSPKAAAMLDSLESAVAAERELSSLQLARTEQLAGVGLSVETASHDLIASGREALRLARAIKRELDLLDLMQSTAYALSGTLIQRLEFVNSRFADVQGLFVSSRQKAGPIDVASVLRKVRSMYEGLHRDSSVTFEIEDGLRLTAVSTEAAVMQCIINLVDNATFWLLDAQQPRVLRAFKEGNSIVISDSGPGVSDADAPYIFEAFYSGRGDEGKGLGLYIARQNGLRNGFAVELLEGRSDTRLLRGAAFRITFEKVSL